MAEGFKVAVVDDEEVMRESVSQLLDLSGYAPLVYSDAASALSELTAEFAGIVITDIRMPGMDGMELLRRLQAMDGALPVILITGHGDVPMAVEAMQIGAYDFVEKPFDPERLLGLVEKASELRKKALETRAIRRELADSETLQARLIGASPMMTKLREQIVDVAQSDGHVLILGETGTGKTLTAQAIHATSPRQGKAYNSVSCQGQDPETLERLLFGPQAGDTAPLVNASRDGTLVIEDIDAMPDNVQARLVSYLAAREAGDPAERAGTRIIATSSNTQLAQAALVRDDLYHRLATMQITLAPLRERGEDIITLFNHYTSYFADEYGGAAPSLSPSEVAAFLQAPWPGNLRQLINLSERAALLNQEEEGAMAALIGQLAMENGEIPAQSKALKEHVDAFEKTLIENTLRRHNGSVAAVMEELSLPRRTLNEKMQRYNINRSDFT
ncbi:sigma-54-dependent transcriptional regulator [Paracoccaceae bacterium GXU_MW_L88]